MSDGLDYAPQMVMDYPAGIRQLALAFIDNVSFIAASGKCIVDEVDVVFSPPTQHPGVPFRPPDIMRTSHKFRY
jgi:hypothetical protein